MIHITNELTTCVTNYAEHIIRTEFKDSENVAAQVDHVIDQFQILKSPFGDIDTIYKYHHQQGLGNLTPVFQLMGSRQIDPLLVREGLGSVIGNRVGIFGPGQDFCKNWPRRAFCKILKAGPAGPFKRAFFYIFSQLYIFSTILPTFSPRLSKMLLLIGIFDSFPSQRLDVGA